MKLSLSTEWLFFHLWKKNPDTNLSCPGVFVADTIIYRWAQPYFWYFTAKDGQILRKTKERIFVEQIEDIFMKCGDIAALYLQSQQNKIIFEYFQKSDFNLFLHQREKALNALLQKFIDPKNKHNSMIKVSWSPQFCLLSRKTNVNDLTNNKISIEDRLATFEGAEHLSSSDSIASPILSADIEQICLNIVKHIQDVSGGNIQISRMVLFFKIDEKNRLWLLFSSGVKVRQKFINEDTIGEMPKQKDRIMSPIMVLQSQPKKMQVPKLQIDTTGMVSQNSQICNNCSQKTDLYNLTVSQYIEAYDRELLDDESKLIRAKMLKHPVQKSEDENDYFVEQSINIPGILLKMWGKMDYEKYMNFKANPSFMKIKLQFCVECFLYFTSEQVVKFELHKQKPQQIKILDTLKETTSSPIRFEMPIIKAIPIVKPIVPRIDVKKLPSEHIQSQKTNPISNFPSQRAPLIYKNKQGIQLPSAQSSFSLNTTKSTLTHSQRLQGISELKQLLANEKL